MWASHFAAKRISIGSITLLIEPSDELELAVFGVYHANGMTLTVGKPNVAFRIDGNALGAA
jgi:hypothetical protein